MSDYKGDFVAGATVRATFNSYASAGESTTITELVASDVWIYRDGVIQSTLGAGVTVEINVGSTGSHRISIDTSNTTDAGFYAAGHDYEAKLNGALIDTKTVNPFTAEWSIQNRYMRGTDNAALATSTVSPDTTWHIATTGNDSNGGHSRLDAKLTLDGAYNAASSGDTIIVWPGTYVSPFVGPTDHQKRLNWIGMDRKSVIVIPASGNAWVFGAGSANSQITTMTINTDGNGSHGLDIQDDNIIARDCDALGENDGLFVVDDVLNFQMYDSYIQSVAFDAVQLNDSVDTLIDNCVIESLGIHASSVPCRGVTTTGGCLGAVVRNSDIIVDMQDTVEHEDYVSGASVEGELAFENVNIFVRKTATGTDGTVIAPGFFAGVVLRPSAPGGANTPQFTWNGGTINMTSPLGYVYGIKLVEEIDGASYAGVKAKAAIRGVSIVQKDSKVQLSGGIVEVVVGGSETTDFRDDTLFAAFSTNDFFNSLIIHWLTGANAGTKLGITDYAVSAAERLVVIAPAANDIVVGDTYEVLTSRVNSISVDTDGGDLTVRDAVYDTALTEGTFIDTTEAILEDTDTTIPAQLDSMSGETFSALTDSLEAIRNRGDASWTTGAGGDATAANQAILLAKLLAYVQLTLREDAAIDFDNATELAEINANEGSGVGAYLAQNDSQEAIKGAIVGGGGTPLLT